MLADSPHNCIFVGSVFYGEDWQPFLVAGGTPMLMWPADTRALRALATGSVKMVTLFNPAHMLSSLLKKGLSIARFEPPKALSLSLETAGRTLTLERAESFMQMVYMSLYSEAYVAQVIVETVDKLKDQPVGEVSTIDLTMSHHVFF